MEKYLKSRVLVLMVLECVLKASLVSHLVELDTVVHVLNYMVLSLFALCSIYRMPMYIKDEY